MDGSEPPKVGRGVGVELQSGVGVAVRVGEDMGIRTSGPTVAARDMATYDRYGSAVMKQGYVYGALDTGPTVLRRGFGFRWAIGGWLLFHALRRLDPATVERMRQRIVDEMTTTFASHYTSEVSLAEMLKPEIAKAYNKRATGEKFLVRPNGKAS